ncbi:MAG: T9SS type A sorting domain-containing protein [Salibacteraceae bacterium]
MTSKILILSLLLLAGNFSTANATKNTATKGAKATQASLLSLGDSLGGLLHKFDEINQKIAYGINSANRLNPENTVVSDRFEAVYTGFRYMKPRKIDEKIYHLKQDNVWVKSNELQNKYVVNPNNNKVYKALNTSTQGRMLFLQIKARVEMPIVEEEPIVEEQPTEEEELANADTSTMVDEPLKGVQPDTEADETATERITENEVVVPLPDASTEAEPTAEVLKKLGAPKGNPENNAATELPVSWSIYPNPATDRLYFSELKPGATFRLLTIDGKVIMTNRMETNSINIAPLPPGTYLVLIDGRAEKFIKR